MDHPTSHPDTRDGTDVGDIRESPPGTPRWVKLFGIALLVLILLIAIMLASGHGPGRHFSGMSGAVVGGQVSAVSVARQVVQQP